MPFALAAARRGWHVFPLRPGHKTPLAGFTDWEQHATADPDRIAAFWGRRPFNVAVACGPSRLVVIDLDTPKPGKTPPPEWDLPGINEGADAFALLCERAGQPFPTNTFAVRTRRDGLHLYYDVPPGLDLRNTNGRHGWLIDTRAGGGYVVGPGSHVALPDGTGTYDVVNDAPPAPLPGWLLEILTAPIPTPTPQLGARLSGDVADLDGYLQAALNGEARRVVEAQIGGRNHALNKAAYNLGRLVGAGALPEPVVRETLTEAVSIHLSPGRDGFTETEALATINAALTAGARRPRTITRRQEVAA
ncbi:bifunctional DNA primase/polymerase [Actinocorallia longicatena]|uniref:Bifunctional DNA primase/polymerase n=1 Tax=Actinocorallia longicatena TaxID=111803 RepID=A0ABP6QGK3_9ACTN